MIQYFKCKEYADTDEEMSEIITQLKAVRTSLLDTALKSVAKGNIAEYELDTGQTKTRVKYTSAASVMNSVKGYDMLIQYYQNKINQGPIRLVGSNNLRQA